MELSLTNKRVLVTAGASGIGRSIVDTFINVSGGQFP